MSIEIGPGGGGGGSAAFDLGPAQNTFVGATRTAAESARDTYATANAAWLALYTANRSYRIALMESASGPTYAFQRRDAAGTGWEDITGLVRGRQGIGGSDGAPGGGAIEPTGVTLDGTANRPANEFIATGLMLGVRGATPYIVYRLVPDTLALLWFSTDGLYDIETATSGDTSTDGSGTIARNRLTLPESAGSSVSGIVYAGLTDAGELLISVSSANVDITVEFFRYVPSAVQGGLSDAERAELSRLSGVETDATKDQTGAEIKTAYEGESDTNAFTDARASKLGGIYANSNSITPYKIGNIYRAYSSGATPVKPGNTEGTVAITGITVAPVGWQLTRPEPTTALSDVYDCHVYGYTINEVFGWQFGTPNRTDRYIDLSALAPLASPALTGIPTLPTAALGTNTTQAASTAYVIAQIAGLIFGVTAGAGLTGGGTDGDVNLDIDPSESDFPTIPIEKGGTGAATATAARTALGLDSIIRFGTGAPADSLGNNGDFYIATDTGGFYTKDSGAWTLRYTDQTATGGSGLDQTAVDARVQAALQAAVQGNTETGINVTYHADGTIDFVVGASAAHTRFAATREADGNFGLSDLSGTEVTTSETDELTLPAWTTGNRFFAIYQETAAAEYTDIREQGSAFNARASFAIAPAFVTYLGEELRIYIYDSQLLPVASGDIWETSS